MTWNPLDDEINHIVLAGQQSPGFAVVSNADDIRRIKKFQGFALSGARAIYRGKELAEPLVTISLYETEGWDEWHRFRRLLYVPPVGVRAKALDIWHPFLEMHDIRAVLVKSVSQPRQVQDGVWSIQIKMVEHRRPKPHVAKVDGADKPKDALDRALDAERLKNRVLRQNRDFWAGENP